MNKDTSELPRTYPRIYCCTNGCLNSSIKKPHMSFFKLPRDEKRRLEWLQLISREDLSDKKAKSYVVCEEHFHAHEILRAEYRKNLKKNAVPSLNLPGMHGSEVVAFEVLVRSDVGTQTDITANKPTNTSPSKNLKRKLNLIHKPTKRTKLREVDKQTEKMEVESFHKLCDKLLTHEFAELVKVQTSAGHRRKNFSLSIKTEINEKVMSILQVKVQNMPEKARNCSLIIDTMDLKSTLVYNTKEDRIIGFHEVDGVQTPEPATAAVVLILRGIVVKWQQPIGFALVSEYRNYEEISKWIDKLVGRLFDVGLNLRAFVSDMSTDAYNLAKERSISPEKPFFFIKKKKIFYVFDAPELIKMVRDSLLVNDFNYHGRVANIDAIREFYEQAAQKNCKLASTLTDHHFNPDSNERKKILLAVQLLSKSVAAAVSTYIDFYVIDESARDTVHFIELMNDLFDVLNSVNVKNEVANKKAFRTELEQLQVLAEAMTFFKSLKLVERQSGVEVTSTAKFIQGFQITICSVMVMMENLTKLGIKCLRTRWLNKELTEKIFDQIRNINGISGDPSSHQFVSAFRQLLITDLIKPTHGKDCSLEVAKLLAYNACEKANDALQEMPSESKDNIMDEVDRNVNVRCSDYNQLEIQDEHTVVFLSSYLLKRCAEKHVGCQTLRKHIAPAAVQWSEYKYQRYREYSRLTKTSFLVVPDDHFIKFVEMMEQEFRAAFKKKHVNIDVAASIYKEINKLRFAPSCPCFPTVYLKKLFIRMRIFQTIQYNNGILRTYSNKRKYFTVPNL